MPVFNLCLKIFRRNWLAVFIYVAIFVAISVTIAITSVHDQSSGNGFTQQKAKIAFISEEKTPLTEGFRQELAKHADFVSIPDSKEQLQDALFFRQVTYVLRIPKGFTKNILDGGTMQIEKTIVPESVENAYIDIDVQQYWNLARLYVRHDPGLTQEQLTERLRQNLDGDTPVRMNVHEHAKTKDSFSMYYFNFLSYALSAILIMGISTVMIVFNKQDLRRRIFCSPSSPLKVNLQIILADLLFAAVALVALVGFCFLLDAKSFTTPNMPYFLVNAVAFTACITSLSFLVGNLLNNLSAMSGVCNILTLGPSFISGVFVPQEFLNDTVLKIASFTPTYWYVQANTKIAKLTDFDWQNLRPVFTSTLILLTFTAAFAALSLVVGKRKRLME
ncbi:ABC transporter permease [Sporolactobacillus sp. CPB3-1]|uniref:ABC transporter permease n=1 Tax=Sporolactobacillus mangiferae TaxID=2940498 RepID=A0ABT0M872_9BACL|nr:ABC transporter permease [Sporolactobacillus mangiferae]MCL1631064.1 ABC transporter permease [Sporolactobacillus mangiferae]